MILMSLLLLVQRPELIFQLRLAFHALCVLQLVDFSQDAPTTEGLIVELDGAFHAIPDNLICLSTLLPRAQSMDGT